MSYHGQFEYDRRIKMPGAAIVKSNIILIISLLVNAKLILMPANSHAQNWPQWRGPTDNNIAESGNFPVKFSAIEDLLWMVPLPGKGSSTPIVWQDNILLTSGVGEGELGEDGVLCYNWEGNLVWQVKLGKQIAGKHPRGSGSCPSIVTDGKQIIAYFKSGTLAALDFNGNILWKINLRQKYGEISMFWDLGTSPVLVDNKVIVAVLHEEQSYLLALEKTTGDVIWKVNRNYLGNVECPQSYTTPKVICEGGHITLIVWGADHLTGHDVETGKTIWVCGGFNPDNKEYWRTIASPAIYKDIAVVPYGRGKYLAGVAISGRGDITESARLWEKKGIGTDVATPVAHDDLLYVISFSGKVWCLEIKTGKVMWNSKLPTGRGMIYSSPILAENRIYIGREEGDFYVCEVTSKGMNVLHQAKFEDYLVATPVLVRDRIIIRGEKNLYCIGN